MGKKKHLVWCDACALYGVDADRIERTNYERFFALYLNRTRSMCRQGYAIQLGIFAGLGKHIGQRMGLAWFLALTENEEEAKFKHEKARASE